MNALSNTDIVACSLVSDWPKPPIPSFNVGCDVCGARVWISQQAPIEPIRLCPACATAQNVAKCHDVVELATHR